MSLSTYRGVCLAFLNYTYGSNTPLPASGKAIRPFVIHEPALIRAIESARSEGADFVIICLHWGAEYHLSPSPAQRALASKLLAFGADIIVGSHPHVPQPIEVYNFSGDVGPKAVAWSLGNYISCQRTYPRERSAILSIEIEKKEKIPS